MQPELPPLPVSAKEEPSEIYQVHSPGRWSSAGTGVGQTVKTLQV